MCRPISSPAVSSESAAPATIGGARQMEIYLAPEPPSLPLAAEALEQAACQRLDPGAYDYVAGGAGGDDTMRANLAAFARWRLVPRLLRNVGRRDLSVSLLGSTLPAPLLLAPIGVQSIVHPDAEVAAARAAASLGVPFAISTASSKTLEEVAAAMGEAPRWFQLYWSRDSELAASLVRRAEAAGYGAIVVTLDTFALGWRERDLQRAYLPFLQGEGMANYLTDPVFRAALPRPPEADPQAAIRHFLGVFGNPTLTWGDLVALRGWTRLPILLKGVLHAGDARRALDAGVDGIVVSNHGGRQVDGAIGALDALPPVVETVAGRVPVLFDSGIRRGPDVLKAVALGAAAVLLGRPYIWALALGGEAGVREYLKNFLADLDVTLALSGYTSFTEIDRSALARASP